MATRPVVMSGPSGSGKSTLLNKLMDEYKNVFGFSVSHTTRKPRPGEQHGKDYYFVERAEMVRSIESGEFIESAEYSNNLYGTSKKAVDDVLKTGRICILDVDSEGVKSIKKTGLNARYVFIAPPSVQVLEERLRSRGTESEESLRKRMELALRELEYAKQPGTYDHSIVNGDLDVAYTALKDLLISDINAVMASSQRKEA